MMKPEKNREDWCCSAYEDDGRDRIIYQYDQCIVSNGVCNAPAFKRTAGAWSVESDEKCRGYMMWHLCKSGNHEKDREGMSPEEAVDHFKHLVEASYVGVHTQTYQDREEYRNPGGKRKKSNDAASVQSDGSVPKSRTLATRGSSISLRGDRDADRRWGAEDADWRWGADRRPAPLVLNLQDDGDNVQMPKAQAKVILDNIARINFCVTTTRRLFARRASELRHEAMIVDAVCDQLDSEQTVIEEAQDVLNQAIHGQS